MSKKESETKPVVRKTRAASQDTSLYELGPLRRPRSKEINLISSEEEEEGSESNKTTKKAPKKTITKTSKTKPTKTPSINQNIDIIQTPLNQEASLSSNGHRKCTNFSRYSWCTKHKFARSTTRRFSN